MVLSASRKIKILGDENETTTKKFFDEKARFLEKCGDPRATQEEKEKSKKAFQAHVDGNYMKATSQLLSAIEVTKATVTDIIKFLYGTAEAGVVLTANLGAALAPTAIKVGSKILLKETYLVVSKQLAKEIAIISGKIAGKEAGKVAGKKIPLVGLAFGVGLGAFRLLKGDPKGAGLELLSGAASTIPGAGTAASFAIDGILACKDIYEALERLRHYQFVLDGASSKLEGLAKEVRTLEKERDLVTKVFFKPGFDFAKNGQDFVQALYYL